MGAHEYARRVANLTIPCYGLTGKCNCPMQLLSQPMGRRQFRQIFRDMKGIFVQLQQLNLLGVCAGAENEGDRAFVISSFP